VGGDVFQDLALFDLEHDPAEKNNVAGEHPDVVERLQKLANKMKAEMPSPSNPRPANRRRKS
jgi:hypothetical protein